MPAPAPRTGTRHRVTQSATGPGRRWPVVLLHGFAGTDAVWDPLAAELDASGFGYVVRVSYDSFRSDPAAVVAAVHDQVAAGREVTGAAGVHLVGHSLGGLLLRRAVDDGGFAGPATVALIATPHRGVRLARWLPGSCARLLHPTGSPGGVLPRADRSIRWLTFSADRDRWVPPTAARIQPAHPAVANLLVRGAGHRTICRSPALIARLVVELLRSERRAVDGGTGAGPAAVAA